MKEVPQWLLQIHSSPIAAEAATFLSHPEAREGVLQLKRKAVERIDSAYAQGDIDEHCLALMFSDPDQLLASVIGLEDNEPLIIRARSLKEVLRDFPPALNADHTRNIPIGMSAQIIAKPLHIDVGITAPSKGSLWVNTTKPEQLFQTIEQINQRLNARNVRVFKNPTGTELNRLSNFTIPPGSLILTRAEQVRADDLQRIAQLSRGVLSHHVIIAYPPRNDLRFPPEFRRDTKLLYPANAVYFDTIEPNGHQKRYFPIAPNP